MEIILFKSANSKINFLHYFTFLFKVEEFQVPIARPVGRPAKHANTPSRTPTPAKRRRGRPPKHPRPSEELTEKQMKMLCQSRGEVYHHLHIDQTKLVYSENAPPQEISMVNIKQTNLFIDINQI